MTDVSQTITLNVRRTRRTHLVRRHRTPTSLLQGSHLTLPSQKTSRKYPVLFRRYIFLICANFSTVEADPAYDVTVRRVSGESHRSGSIQVSVHRQPSAASLRSIGPREPSPVISETRGQESLLSSEVKPQLQASPDITEKNDSRPDAYESLFGGPKEIDPSKETTRQYQISRAALDRSPERLLPEGEKVDTPTRSSLKPELPTISEQHLEEGQTKHEASNRVPSLHRVPSDASFFLSAEAQAPRPLTPAAPAPAPAPERKDARLISTEDLLARLSHERPRRKSAVSAAARAPAGATPSRARTPVDGPMNVLKRGERSGAGRTPSLRRAGSQLDNYSSYSAGRPSAEHVIFGGDRSRTQTPEAADGSQVFESWGDRDHEPMSPTRPPSVRRRQSLMMIDLENRMETLAAENTTLTHEKANIEKSLTETRRKYQQETTAAKEKTEESTRLLDDRDSEIASLKATLDRYRQEVARLSAENDSLAQTNIAIAATSKQNYAALRTQFDRKSDQYTQLAKEHRELDRQFTEYKGGVEGVIRNEVGEKDAELEQLRSELESARDQVRKLQGQLMRRQSDRYLDIKDSQHFTNSCAQLFGRVRHFSREFSAYSTGTRCVHVHRLTDEGVKDRVENVMLDDRGVRRMLKDENRRPDVFSALIMRCLWEFVFTRYLFGLEREERQKLLSLEKTLSQAGNYPSHSLYSTLLTLSRPAKRSPPVARDDTHAPLAATILRGQEDGRH